MGIAQHPYCSLPLTPHSLDPSSNNCDERAYYPGCYTPEYSHLRSSGIVSSVVNDARVVVAQSLLPKDSIGHKYNGSAGEAFTLPLEDAESNPLQNTLLKFLAYSLNPSDSERRRK